MGKQPAELQVIGAGAGRTGTDSLREALEILGFGPCYHMSVSVRKNHQSLWADALTGEQSLEKYKSILEGYGSAVDFPSSVAYLELMAAYPDAKVILSTRNPTSWAKSAMGTIYNKCNRARSWVMAPWNMKHRRQAFAYRRRFFGGSDAYLKAGVMEDPDALAAALRAWEEKVVASVPAEKLLVFQVAEGWGPLCTFLGVPVPSVEFPHINNTEAFKNRLKKLWRKYLMWDVAVAAGIASIAVGAVMVAKRRY